MSATATTISDDPITQTDAPNTGDATGTNGGQSDAPEKKFTQAELDNILRKRLDQEKQQREKAEAKAREEAEAKALLEQQKYQELAEARAKRIAELEATAAELEGAREQAERYKSALSAHLETQRKGLPGHITTLLDKLDPVEQLEWIAANQAAIGPPNGHKGGVPASPRADGGNLSFEEKVRAEYEARRGRR